MSLRDTNTERIGSASQFVEVPDLKKNRLALSGLALSGVMPTSKTTQSNQAAANQAVANQPANDLKSTAAVDQEGVERGNAEASPAVRHFRSGMLMNYAFFIYNARVDKATNNPKLTTQVRLFRDGKPVFTGNENAFKVLAQAELKRLLAGGSIQLGTDLPIGEYVFQIIVNDAMADEKHRTVSQWMDFEIVK